ncbi:carboxylating nicotinate-nucleotide diphosphorylase [Thiovibrio frasassiensis]|uniref:Probable nicotinate-nucleotide pyrophosphorylase [carboxylating] n=1 Tax=Thiovibrio frasassiensis TaxID=2984131 RepID=A0A9X4MGE6_9BACT|nr:carboxylating nicotinate-nucleotide diphosphorylase [Thiovibrio frasassiensis]MDG4476761.1 carboxylating nicotinate-nucleotide diphosphorylase [Thiovibrio frasassiensis]
MDTQLARQLQQFLEEDIGLGDITTDSVFPPEQQGQAVFVAKEDFVAAGLDEVAPLVFATRNPRIVCTARQKDGDRVLAGAEIFSAQGPVRDLLSAERLALNLVQRMSGIATLTSAFVQQVEGLPVRILDTRKTTPGLRALEKYAVRVGGGHNHRFSLADGILLKDNHIAACGSITKAVQTLRDKAPHTLKIEVETENLAQVEECLACGVEIIMLDNMAPALMRQAVALIGGRALVEASGGVNLTNVREIAETGVDLISVGALTHSARAMDISMRLSV